MASDAPSTIHMSLSKRHRQTWRAQSGGSPGSFPTARSWNASRLGARTSARPSFKSRRTAGRTTTS